MAKRCPQIEWRRKRKEAGKKYRGKSNRRKKNRREMGRAQRRCRREAIRFPKEYCHRSAEWSQWEGYCFRSRQ